MNLQRAEPWPEVRLKFLARVQTGMAKGKDLVGSETVEVPYLRVANVQDGYLDLDEVTTMAVPVSADADVPPVGVGRWFDEIMKL